MNKYATYKGVNFLVLDDQGISGGRRLVVQEYPYRNTHQVDDMGRLAATINVRAIFLGDNYINQAKAFIKVVDTDDASELVHPFHKRGKYFCEAFNCRINPMRRRIAWVDLTLREERYDASPMGALNPISAMINSQLETVNALIDDFNDAFSVVEDTITQLEQTVMGIKSTLGQITDIVQRVASVPGSVIGMGEDLVGSIVGSVQSVGSSVTTLINTPKALGRSLTNCVALICPHYDDGSSQAPYQSVQYLQQLDSKMQLDPVNDQTSYTQNTVHVTNDSDPTETYQVVAGATATLDPVVATQLNTVSLLVESAVLVNIASNALQALAEDHTRIEQIDPEQISTQLNDQMLKLATAGWSSWQAMSDCQIAFINSLKLLNIKPPQTLKLRTTMPALVASYKNNGTAIHWLELYRRHANTTQPNFLMPNN